MEQPRGVCTRSKLSSSAPGQDLTGLSRAGLSLMPGWRTSPGQACDPALVAMWQKEGGIVDWFFFIWGGGGGEGGSSKDWNGGQRIKYKKMLEGAVIL